MKLFYDELMKNEFIRLEDYFPELAERLSKATVFNVDNVAEYYYLSSQVEWDFRKDFPAIMPPFENTFLEFRMPKMGMFIEGLKFINPGLKFGALIVKHDVEKQENIKAILEFVLFGSQNKIPFFMGGMRLAVDKYGAWVPLQGRTYDDGIQYLIPGDTAEQQEIVKNGVDQQMRPIFLAISFLHCKNVKTIQQGTGLNHGRRSRHTPGIRYHVLNIEPMKQVLKTEGNSETVGLKKALHICRGHFKDYRETGLFGKFHDIYWWDSQVRGTLENGVVLKDYKINQPTQEQ